ncbi:site-specific integrase [Paraoerskovia sediminicola]|uniref:Site-specific integrase n=1 Tax=Paraoerskovia sediminicola TaxID=1138587 RepID=A0ABN6X865_9CELL|nr:site-specific integrase [Paraoerskovia sediminicola]BDZ40779.1 site-specific integrase [Paraoerskovia sediminicola]
MPINPQPYRLADGTVKYKVRFRVPGKPNPTSESFTTLAEAKKFVRLIERAGPVAAQEVRQASTTSDLDSPTLRTYLGRHLARLEASATPGTVADYRRMAERTWLARLGDIPLDMLTRDAVVAWVAWQRQQTTRRGTPYSTKSIANAHGLLSTVLAAAVDDELIARNPARGVRLPRDQHAPEMEIFTPSEWDAFYAAMDDHYRPLIAFLRGTGTRIGEATAVQVRDVNLDRGTVRIRRAWKKGAAGTYLGDTKTKRGNRTILLAPVVLERLAPLLEGRVADALVFTAAGGGQIHAHRFRERQWQRALDVAGITKRLTPHSLRHTHASELLTAGVSPHVVQHRLGHEDLSTTSRVYAHLLTDAQAAAVAVSQQSFAPQIEA